MPNHVLNLVTISGDKETIKKVKDQIIVDGEFSFDHIVKEPKEITEMEEHSDLDNAVEYLKASTEEEREKVKEKILKCRSVDYFNKILAQGKQALLNEEKYGARSWYPWRLKNWGTKWDCYEVTYTASETSISLTFQTAWSTPFEVMQALAKQFPTVEIDIEFADEDLGSNCGIYGFKNGEQAYEEMKNDLQFSCDIWGYDYDEITADMEE